jgi:GNAT superfamily N-acetyltransferase
MQRVNDIKHFSVLVRESKPNGKVVATNCYLLPDEINKYIQQNHIFWEKVSDGIVFLCEEREFFYLFFYFYKQQNEQDDLKFEKPNKPVVINLPYFESSNPESLSGIEKQWIRSGFCDYKIYRHMMLRAENQLINEENILFDSSKYKITFAKAEQYVEIENLWKQTLDPFSTALPNGNELLNLLEKKQIICVYDREEKVVAVLQPQLNGKVCMIKHLVVDENHRNNGLATALLLTFISNRKDINKYSLWVDEKNDPAKMLYLKVGFNFDGKIIRQLLLNSELKK